MLPLEKLVAKGYDVRIYDREVSLARSFGSNRKYIEGATPHVSSLLRPNIEEVIESSEVIVVVSKTTEFYDVVGLIKGDKIIIDLV